MGTMRLVTFLKRERFLRKWKHLPFVFVTVGKTKQFRRSREQDPSSLRRKGSKEVAGIIKTSSKTHKPGLPKLLNFSFEMLFFEKTTSFSFQFGDSDEPYYYNRLIICGEQKFRSPTKTPGPSCPLIFVPSSGYLNFVE